MKIEDLRAVTDTNTSLIRRRGALAGAETGEISIQAGGYNVELPGPIAEAVKALIVSGLRQQVADLRKALTDRGVELPPEA
ncbi:hypothetical protein D3093_35115 (plasmid) [Azospirillum argentinense]|uniref:Uncharacterized protein n=1 Tax=Azospirillum argentinense TaxID=2970906 RepID=A0A4D8PUT5_9PROT|nr:hypothetical protein [Azospirillum argentinense]QCO00598.1 hypothetical protein D3093_35115 [Azospirillum argentinense]